MDRMMGSGPTRDAVPSIVMIIVIPLVLLLIVGITVPAASQAGRDSASEDDGIGSPPIKPERPIRSGADGESGIVDRLRTADTGVWVDTQKRDASLDFYFEEFVSSADLESTWSGNHADCVAGTTSDTFRDAILQRVNFYRAMAGVPPVWGFNDTYNSNAQAAALMMSANRDLNHYPPSNWLCYSEEGSEAASSSNLSRGNYGPAAITSQFRDLGENNDPVGHRRWIVYPQTQYMGTGDVPAQDGYPSANTLWVIDRQHIWGPRPETRDDFVAWPPPGYVPYQVIYPRWSFSFPEANFNQAVVSMTRDRQAIALNQNMPIEGYGENTLVWELEETLSGPPQADIRFDVVVQNVVAGGEVRHFNYTVIVIDTKVPPYFTSTPVTDAIQDVDYSYMVTVDDRNRNEGETVSIMVDTLPPWLALEDQGNGRALLTGKPTNSNVGDHAIVLRAIDSEGLSTTQNFAIGVANVNDAPLFVSEPITSAKVYAEYSYVVQASDPDLPWGDEIAISATMLPDWLNFNYVGNGRAKMVGRASDEEIGDHQVVLHVSDSSGKRTRQKFAISVSNQVHLPLLISDKG